MFFEIGNEKRPWDMPTNQSNSILNSWTLADCRYLSQLCSDIASELY
jgi:hypothetical protein